MYSSKIYTLFKSLSTIEKKKLKGIVIAYSQRKDTILLYTYWIENFKQVPSTLDIEYMAKKLNLSVVILRNLLNDIGNCIEKLLLVENVIQKPIASTYYLTQALYEKDIEKMAIPSLTNLQKEVNKAIFDTEWNYPTQKLVQKLLYQQQRDENSNYQAMLDALDTYYCVEKLKLATYVNSHQTLFQIKYQQTLLTECIQWLQRNIHQQSPLTIAYLYVYYFQNSPTWESYILLKKQLMDYETELPFEELKKLYLLLINLSITEMNKGVKEYASELFIMYQKAVQNNYLYLDETHISRFTYSNTVAIGLRLKEYTATYYIIQNWKTLVEEEYQEALYTFNLSRYYYEIKEYKKALKLLLNNQYDDIHLEIAAKSIVIKIYYETRAWDTLESVIASLKMYLRRKEVTEYHKDNYLNFIQFTYRLLELDTDNKKEVDKLKKQIIATDLAINKDWLLLQLNNNQTDV